MYLSDHIRTCTASTDVSFAHREEILDLQDCFISVRILFAGLGTEFIGAQCDQFRFSFGLQPTSAGITYNESNPYFPDPPWSPVPAGVDRMRMRFAPTKVLLEVGTPAGWVPLEEVDRPELLTECRVGFGTLGVSGSAPWACFSRGAHYDDWNFDAPP